ncbi:MAG: hypothetical protein COV78_04425 [Candidatus Pacebacteria bacterium CG11_big_fil_rev_8_21_14_0_20_34_55]|nr:hypothetical protein [Candidatus Paceibacterota bacterium]PIQ80625.1 MAG: hypothetical protein COV78_04425 [Candidatus Pacebacteria bacterium CG11_big_fil_rev_8_21_14_0_20_34_55]
MKQLNSLFIVLFVLIGILSISYIWSSEADKEALIEKSDNQAQEINSLKDQISKLEKENPEKNAVMGVNTTATGIVSGSLKINNAISVDNIIVCAQDKFTIKEFCTDELLETTTPNELKYMLEIPMGKYFIYAIAPPDLNRAYYSKIQKCTDNNNCENNQKILLEIIGNESQKNIDLYF